MTIPFLRQKDIRLVEQLTKDVALLFDAGTLRRGWGLFENDEVRQFDADDRWIINAIVAGRKEVRLDLNSILGNGAVCTCEYSGYCEHMAAVLFFFYKKYGLSAKLLLPDVSFAEIRQRSFTSPAPPASSAARQSAPPARRSSVSVPTAAPPRAPAPSPDRPPAAAISETDSPELWHHFIEKQLDGLSIASPSTLGTYRRAVESRLLPYAKGWSVVASIAFQLHVQLYILRQLEASFREISQRYFIYGFDSLYADSTNEIAEHIAKLIRQPGSRSEESSHLALYEGVARTLAAYALEDGNSVVNWMRLYRLLWSELLRQDSLRQEEKARLQRVLGAAPPSMRRDLHALALAHFDVLEGRDERAMERLDRELDGNESVHLFEYVPIYWDAQRWDKVQIWLHWLLPRIKESNDPDMLEAYCECWIDFANRRSLGQQLRDTLVYLLPDSVDIFADYLLKEQSYREWVDLMLMCNYTADEVDPAFLHKLETKDTTAAMAYLHQSVERLIARKNRNDYREAVELLKRLHRMYEKRRESERWQQFIGHLIKRFARQRAFQEELKKGKIPS